MSLLLQIAERAVNRPLLLHPDKIGVLAGVLEGKFPLGDIAALKEVSRQHIDEMPAEAQATMLGPNPTASRFVGSNSDQDPTTGSRTTLPYRRTREGVAIIPVLGSLVNRGAWLGATSGVTSYEGIKFQIAHAVEDKRTTSILLDIDSPGGEAVGCFETAEVIRDASTKKPTTAVVNGMAASAAYALASAANRIVTVESGVVGSIGVVLLHRDFSRKFDKEGVTPTLIFAGSHKVDGHPFAPLPDSVKTELQAEINQFYMLFVRCVAAGRVGLTQKAIRATEARTFIGKDAVKHGLADMLGTFETALADLSLAQSGQSKTNRRATKMSNENGAPDALSGLTNKEVDAKVATTKTEAHAAGKTEGKTEAAAAAKLETETAVATAKADAVKAERQRIVAITGLEEAKGREAAALNLALTSDLSVDQVKGVLSAVPKASAVQGARSGDNPIGLTMDPSGKQAGGAKPGSSWDKALAGAGATLPQN